MLIRIRCLPEYRPALWRCMALHALPLFNLFHICGASAQHKLAFPIKPVRLLIPFAAAGSNDVAARLLGQKLATVWKQQVVMDNRPGANGIIGTDMAAKAPADGYTLVIASTTFTMNPSLYKLPYNTSTDFAPVSVIADGPLVLCSHPAFAATSVEQLIALAKAKPASVQYASAGLGGIAHLAGVLFEKSAGVSLLHIPYKGSGAGVIDVMSGQVPLIFSSVSPVLPFLHSGKLRALGIGGVRRSGLLPNVPTIVEGGVPGYESNMWWGILAPGRTPMDIVRKLNGDTQTALDDADIQQRFGNLGMDVRRSTPAEFSRIIESGIRKWGATIKAAKVDVNAL